MPDRTSLVDFGLITALPEEFSALKSLLGKCEEIPEAEFTFYRSRVPVKADTGGFGYEVVATFSNAMGQLDAMSVTEKVIQRWNPTYIIMVGIAGSLDSDIQLGDVVVSQDVLYYDPGKETEEGKSYRPMGFPANRLLVNRVNAFAVDKKALSNWQQQCQRQLKGVEAVKPQLHVGTLASGSNVIASSQKKEELRQLHGKLFAVEMEAAGVLLTAYSKADPHRAIIIRGISDRADKDKSATDARKIWRAAAAQNAVRFTLALLRRGGFEPLATDTFTLDPTRGTAEECTKVSGFSAGASHLSFPELIHLHGPGTHLSVELRAWDGTGRTLKIKAMTLLYIDGAGKQRRLDLQAKAPVERAALAVDAKSPEDAVSRGRAGLYVVVDGDVDRIELNVRTPVHSADVSLASLRAEPSQGVPTNRKGHPSEQVDVRRLRELMSAYFNDSELRNLCFDLRIDYDNLGGLGKADKVRELIAYCERNGIIDELVTMCIQERPHVAWREA